MTATQTPSMVQQGWHLDKRVPLVHIITTITAILAAVVWLTTQEKRISINELMIAKQDQANTQALIDLKAQSQAQYAEIIRRLERFDERLFKENGN